LPGAPFCSIDAVRSARCELGRCAAWPIVSGPRRSSTRAPNGPPTMAAPRSIHSQRMSSAGVPRGQLRVDPGGRAPPRPTVRQQWPLLDRSVRSA
jgi:hypothetical protein